MSYSTIQEMREMLRDVIAVNDQLLWGLGVQPNTDLKAAAIVSSRKAEKEIDYLAFIEDTFYTHYEDCSLPMDDAENVIETYSFYQIEKWLKKIGYDLAADYENWIVYNGGML